MFELDMLWVWFLLYIVCMFIWCIYKNEDDCGLFEYLLLMAGMIGSFAIPFIVMAIVLEKTGNLWIAIPGTIMFCLFLASNTDKYDFFSKETLKRFLSFILGVSLLIIALICFANKDSDNLFIQIICLLVGGPALLIGLCYVNSNEN